MEIKEIVILIIFCIFLLPLLIKTVVFSSNITRNTAEETTDQAAELIKEATIPWWTGIISWLADLGELGAFLIIGFVIFVKWIGETK